MLAASVGFVAPLDKFQEGIKVACIGRAQGREIGFTSGVVGLKVETARPFDRSVIEVIPFLESFDL